MSPRFPGGRRRVLAKDHARHDDRSRRPLSRRDATFTSGRSRLAGNTIASDPVIVPFPRDVDQANLADAFDPNPLWFVGTNAGVSFPSTQSFTAAQAGGSSASR